MKFTPKVQSLIQRFSLDLQNALNDHLPGDPDLDSEEGKNYQTVTCHQNEYSVPRTILFRMSCANDAEATK